MRRRSRSKRTEALVLRYGSGSVLRERNCRRNSDPFLQADNVLPPFRLIVSPWTWCDTALRTAHEGSAALETLRGTRPGPTAHQGPNTLLSQKGADVLPIFSKAGCPSTSSTLLHICDRILPKSASFRQRPDARDSESRRNLRMASRTGRQTISNP